ncbi:MAG: helix-turn-helix domain-containing protein, partial [Pirellulales bacterium]
MMLDVDERPDSAATPRLLDGEGDLVPLGRAARKLGKDPATLWRWREQGVRVRGTEQRVRLAMVRLGGRWYIRPADLEAFTAAAAGDDVVETPAIAGAIAVVT